MDHIYPGVMEPIEEVIGNLISLPGRCLSALPERKRKRQLDEREAEISRMEHLLTVRTAELSEKELDLKERSDAGRIYRIPVGEILPNPYQPRREFEDLALYSLTDSVKRHGILQPLTVRRENAQQEGELAMYTLICGERRLRAALAAGMQDVPCIILEADNRRAAELALIENLQRENLNMFEQAGAIAALMDMHAMTQEEIARSLSLSQSCIANRLRILKLTEEERNIVLANHLSERHARAVLRIKNLDDRKEALGKIASDSMTVSRAEEYIDTLCTDRVPAVLRVPPVCENDSPEKKSVRRKKAVLGDLRLFFNTLDRAASALREAGISAKIIKHDDPDSLLVTVRIPKS
ncbi:MAG: ParB/RepB/Spo0J family partition protein [Clostridia bacterium]|nr:ParB/RepB/Spo0J family partition protein [Clostridia bacterium]